MAFRNLPRNLVPGRRYKAAQFAYRSERRCYEQEQMKVPRTSLLYTHPPESGEGPVHPLKALVQSFEVTFTAGWILWVFPRVGQRHEDHPPLEGPEGSSVDTRQPPQQIPAACPGEAPYTVSNTSTAPHRRTPVVPGCGVLEGECGYRPPNRGGYVGNALI